MHYYERSVTINSPIERVFDFHNNTENLLKISPPSIKVTIQTKGTPGLGYEVQLRVTQFFLLTTTWVVKITAFQRPNLLIDEQLKGPFAMWKQTRTFVSTEKGTTLTDGVEYKLPFGFLGVLANKIFVANQIKKMFEYRQLQTKQLLEVSIL